MGSGTFDFGGAFGGGGGYDFGSTASSSAASKSTITKRSGNTFNYGSGGVSSGISSYLIYGMAAALLFVLFKVMKG